DQVSCDPRLPLRERMGARVIRVPRAAATDPLRRPVGVEIDAASVLANTASVAVRVQVRDDPKVEARVHTLERPRNRYAGALERVHTGLDLWIVPNLNP